MLRSFIRIRRSLVKQYDRKDCGPAALLSVVRYYGGDTTLADIRNRCYTSSRGTTMYDIVETAKEIGFRARGMIGSYENLMKIKLPCIVHWILADGFQHFVVIYRVNSKRIEVGDPGKGIVSLSRTKFDTLWQTKALIVLNPGYNLVNKKVTSLYTWLLKIIYRERVWIYQILFLGFIYTGIGLLTAAYIRQLIDRFIPSINQAVILWSALFLCFLFILRAFIGWIRYYFLVVLNKRVGIRLNANFISHVFQLSQQFFDLRKRGDIIARLHDCLHIQNAVVKICGTLIIDIIMIMGSLVYMYVLAPKLALLTLSFTPIFVVTILLPIRKIKKRQNEVMRSFSEMESTFIDSLSGIDDIISFNTNHIFALMNRKKCKSYQISVARLGYTQGRLNFFADFTTAVISLIILTYGALFVIRGEIQMGQMIAAYTLLNHMIPSIVRSIDSTVSWQGSREASKRLLDIILQNREHKDMGVAFRMQRSLEIRNASFGWSRTNILFQNITIVLQKGYMTALYGPSGSGKTTIANLIQRKYSLRTGSLLIDSTEAKTIMLREYRNNISIVPQHVWVFTGTLYENILIGRYKMNEELFSEFIKTYQLNRFIERFQHGLLTLLGEEGRRLSGGEKQVLGLTRALLAKPDILIIDEGFNSMDQDLYNIFFGLIKKYAQTAAILINTHNLETVSRADCVYILKNGHANSIGKSSALKLMKSMHTVNNQEFV